LNQKEEGKKQGEQYVRRRNSRTSKGIFGTSSIRMAERFLCIVRRITLTNSSSLRFVRESD